MFYWWNWNGIRDLASHIQIQRGMGNSKIMVPSLGATMQIIAKAMKRKKTGFLNYSVGNDNFHKMTASYESAINKQGWGFSALASRTQGDGYIHGTKFRGYTYFFSALYKPNTRQQFKLMAFDAPQQHDQSLPQSIQTLLKYGRRHSSNYGYLKKQYLPERRTFYQRPVVNLNWNWNLSKKLSLSTLLYGSWSNGGTTRLYPVTPKKEKGDAEKRRDAKTGLIDWDAIYKVNRSIAPVEIEGRQYIVGDKDNGASLISSAINNQLRYGLRSDLSYKTRHWAVNGGVDLRHYRIENFSGISDFLGLSAWHEDDQIARPGGFYVFHSHKPNEFFAHVKATNRIGYDNVDVIDYSSLFSQLSYKSQYLSAFVQLAGSKQDNVRWDYMNYLPPHDDKSPRVTNWGYQVKGGLNFKPAWNQSLFINAGYNVLQPLQNNIFLNFRNEVNPVAKNQKVINTEVGYGFESQYFTMHLGLYNTVWKDRAITKTTPNVEVELDNGSRETSDIVSDESGITETHRGVEFNFEALLAKRLKFQGFFSYGDWKYDKNAVIKTFDVMLRPVKPVDLQTNKPIEDQTIYLKGKKVPNAAQLTYGMGLDWGVFGGLHALLNWKYNGDLYADYKPADFQGAKNRDRQQIKMPDYNLFNAGIYWEFKLRDGKRLRFQFNVDNLLDTDYLSKMVDNNPLGTAVAANGNTYKGMDVSNRVYWGMGRTWSAGVSLRF